jgi:hypothetical protein
MSPALRVIAATYVPPGTSTQLRPSSEHQFLPLHQFLGFLEVLRREGPRERSYLGSGNPQGTDTLATLMEGIRFVLCAYPATLSQWAEEGDLREHPGGPSTPVL